VKTTYAYSYQTVGIKPGKVKIGKDFFKLLYTLPRIPIQTGSLLSFKVEIMQILTITLFPAEFIQIRQERNVRKMSMLS